jgi:hypothetical protein
MTDKPISLDEHFRQQNAFRDKWLQYHAKFVRQRTIVDAVAAHLMTLDGEVLDGYLRELGMDPDELLAEFNATFKLPTNLR